MSTGRTLTDKIADTRAAFAILREEITPTAMREVLEDMTSAQRQLAAAQDGDAAAYAALVQASLQLHRAIAANDRTAMIAAAMLTQSGIARPVIDATEE